MQQSSDDNSYSILVTESDRLEFKRLDQFLSAKLPDVSRTTIKRLFETDQISADIPLELKKMPPVGTIIEVDIPPPIDTDLKAENIPLEVLFEDEFLIVINKPAGLVVHPAPGHYTGTLVNAILWHCKDLKGVGHEKRPGIVHRLDQGTSGVMVIAKEQTTHEKLVDIFSRHDIKRQYQAIVYGKPQNLAGKLESTIGRSPQNRLKMAANVKNGKKAITFYKQIATNGSYSHLELTLETGRTHQIRVHLSQLLHLPIVCDPLYSNPKEQIKKFPENIMQELKDYPYQLLHAKHLSFTHPKTGELLSFTHEPPLIFQKALEYLNKIS